MTLCGGPPPCYLYFLMRKHFLVLLGGLFLLAAPLLASDGPPSGNSLDQGLWWLYQLQYDKALASFDSYIASHPDDPVGYFYKTATDWWHLAQEFEYPLPDIRKRFLEESEKTIAVAKALEASSSDKKTKAHAYLYWGGAEGLRGRWLVTQKEWVNAYFAGKRGARYLKRAVELDPTQYDAYMGLGIYDYFTDTLSGVQAVLAAILIRGDRLRGLKELQMAIDKAPHARVEAMTFLIEIYNAEENTPEKALPIARALRKEFPQSPAMHLMEMSTLYIMKDWDAVLPEARDILEKSEHESPWYTHHTIRAARYCIGVGLLFGKKDLDGALEQFNKIIDEKHDESRWTTFAILRRGQIYDLRNNRGKALQDYGQVMSRPDVWSTHKEASQYMKQPFKFHTDKS